MTAVRTGAGMPGTELLFIAVQAHVGRATGTSRCEFFVDVDDFTPEHLVPIDLADNPNQAPWDRVRVDAHRAAIPPGLTSIGPAFHAGEHRGVVYLQYAYFQYCRQAGQLGVWPPDLDFDYQYMALARRAASGGMARFHGYHAQVIAAHGSLAHVEIYKTQQTTPTVHKTLWIDLGDPAQCDPVERGYTKITPMVGSRGAAFLSWDTIKTLALGVPKLPPGEGFEALP